MESQFEIDTKHRMELHDPLHRTVIFLLSQELGLRMPIALTEDELENLEIALQEGIGATPPQIQAMVLCLKEFTIAKISVLDFDVERCDFSAAVYVTDSRLEEKFIKLGIVEALMMAVYAGVSPMVNGTAIAHQMDSRLYSPIFESFKGVGDYEADAYGTQEMS